MFCGWLYCLLQQQQALQDGHLLLHQCYQYYTGVFGNFFTIHRFFNFTICLIWFFCDIFNVTSCFFIRNNMISENFSYYIFWKTGLTVGSFTFKVGSNSFLKDFLKNSSTSIDFIFNFQPNDMSYLYILYETLKMMCNRGYLWTYGHFNYHLLFLGFTLYCLPFMFFLAQHCPLYRRSLILLACWCNICVPYMSTTIFFSFLVVSLKFWNNYRHLV